MDRRKGLTALASALHKETEGYGRLLAASHEHGDSLLTGKPESIEATLQEQLRAMEDCRQGTNNRLEQTQTMASDLGLGAPCSTGRLLRALPDGETDALAEPYEKMKRTSAQLVEQNARNRRLSEHRLDLLQGDFESLQRMARRAAGHDEDDGEPVEGSLLSTKA